MKTFQQKLSPSKVGKTLEIQSYIAVNSKKPEFLTNFNSHILEKPVKETLFKKKAKLVVY